MAKRWLIQEADETKVENLAQQIGLPVSIVRVLFLRGFSTEVDIKSFLHSSLAGLQSPFELSGMMAAAERIAKAIENRESILIHGDFDADGISSTALLVLFFKELGVNVYEYIPNRLYEGHGISKNALEIAKSKKVTLMITCDCGSSNGAEIELFLSHGVETIITDHHHVGDSDLSSAIIVNPRHDDSTGHEGLAGVGVAFMLALATRSVLRKQGYFNAFAEPNLKVYLDIVALGTVADLAPLRGQNRILVSEGLKQISISKRPGIVSMKKLLGLAENTVDTQVIGFKMAPKINAAARLGYADQALEWFLSNDLNESHRLTARLIDFNEERQKVQEKMMYIAMPQAEEQIMQKHSCIIISSAEFHSGVAGLVAQKLAEQYVCPVFIFSVEGLVSKASARSRGGRSIFEILKGCEDVLIQFGGHDEAGGCSLHTSNLELFKRKAREVVSMMAPVEKSLKVDAILPLSELDEVYFSSLKKLQPFGMGNPQPTFMTRATIAGPLKRVGSNHLKATFMGDDGRPFEGIGFGLWNDQTSSIANEAEIVFSVEENIWQGRRSLQLFLKDIIS